jgi:hypothetical protein
MDCSICKKTIEKYDSRFNHLIIDENCSVDICEDCTHKILEWQGSLIAKLFPTSVMKKRFGKKSN